LKPVTVWAIFTVAGRDLKNEPFMDRASKTANRRICPYSNNNKSTLESSCHVSQTNTPFKTTALRLRSLFVALQPRFAVANSHAVTTPEF
jgi:hypothetical protein